MASATVESTATALAVSGTTEPTAPQTVPYTQGAAARNGESVAVATAAAGEAELATGVSASSSRLASSSAPGCASGSCVRSTAAVDACDTTVFTRSAVYQPGPTRSTHSDGFIRARAGEAAADVAASPPEPAAVGGAMLGCRREARRSSANMFICSSAHSATVPTGAWSLTRRCFMSFEKNSTLSSVRDSVSAVTLPLASPASTRTAEPPSSVSAADVAASSPAASAVAALQPSYGRHVRSERI
mmetsp:Transcript_33989/g.104925  ORF Transcript_33989/g.104925 Transcript_33989/m.104925 type:complete len:244 (+) Transcript_33989:723-1454(+)